LLSFKTNKIHVYSLGKKPELRNCISCEIPITKILNLAFSKKNQFISLLFDDLQLETYTVNKKILEACKCNKNPEKNIFSSLFENLKVFLNI
jgi:hypothetical protein